MKNKIDIEIDCMNCRNAVIFEDRSVGISAYVDECEKDNATFDAKTCPHFDPRLPLTELYFCLKHNCWSDIDEFGLCRKSAVDNPFEEDIDCLLLPYKIGIMRHEQRITTAIERGKYWSLISNGSYISRLPKDRFYPTNDLKKLTDGIIEIPIEKITFVDEKR